MTIQLGKEGKEEANKHGRLAGAGGRRGRWGMTGGRKEEWETSGCAEKGVRAVRQGREGWEIGA